MTKPRGLVCALLLPPLLVDAAEFSKPFRLEAGGDVIDTRGHMPYAGPLIGDVTGDGVDDLTVTTISGVFLVYENLGGNGAGDPAYRRAEDLPEERVPPELDNW